jgi:alkylation response protein AidB-like acyl-CoA dehydrogenase
MKEIPDHTIQAPRLGNQFLEDYSLQRFLSFYVKPNYLEEINKDLLAFGDKVSNEYIPQMKEAELNQPRLIHYTPYNERIDQLILSEGWRFFKDQTSIEGLVSIPYENRSNEYSRLHYFSKIYLFHPSSALFTCPIAMTDGCAFLIQQLLKQTNINSNGQLRKLLEDVFMKLTTRNPKKFWTAGQWMTERLGGSDVSGSTQTIALAVDPAQKLYALHGYKFFTSSTDSEVAMALARIVKPNATPGDKPAPLSLFIVLVKPGGKSNNIEIVRLKDKLGTRQLPTAELRLKGTLAFLVSEEGQGIKTISQLVNITRIHNAVAAVSSMRRIVNLAKDYAATRLAFGRKLNDLPLQINILNSLELSTQGNLLLVLEATKLQGLIENKLATLPDKSLHRLMIPLMKMFTGKEGVRVVSEGIECFGGMGYMEDSSIPQLLRDVQVTPIWEGTTNIQALDFLRALHKEPTKFKHVIDILEESLISNGARNEDMINQLQIISKKLKNLQEIVVRLENNTPFMTWNAKKIARNVVLALIVGLSLRLYGGTGFEQFDTALRNFWVLRCLSEWEEVDLDPVDKIRQAKRSIGGEYLGKDIDSRGEIRPKL